MEVLKSLQHTPIDFDIKANRLAQLIQGYKPEIQLMQTIPQRIYCASYFVCMAMNLEHDLLWGTYGYQTMVRRLTLKLPFRDAQEATQYLILPVRYYVAMKLKSLAARFLNAARTSYESRRSSLEGFARGLGWFFASYC